MPSAIVWDGGPTGNGTNWLDPVNWVGDALPGAADDVVIGSTGSDPVILLGGSSEVHSIASSRSIDVVGLLTIHADSWFETLSMTGNILSSATLTVAGPFVRTFGTLSGSGGRLVAAGGADVEGNDGHYTFLDDGFVLETPAGAEHTWGGGWLGMRHGGRWENAGHLTIGVPGNPYGRVLDGEGTGGAFVNTGTVDVTGVRLACDVDNGGTIAVHGGLFIGHGYSVTLSPTGKILGDPGSQIELFSAVTAAAGSEIRGDAVTVSAWGADCVIGGTFSANATTIGSQFGWTWVAMTGTIEKLGALNCSYLDLSGATFTPAAATLDSLTISGPLTGTDTLRVNGPMIWSSGTITLPGLEILDYLTVSGSRNLVGTHLVNAGTLVWTGGNVSFSNGGAFTNEVSGIFELTDGFFGNPSACIPFINRGLIIKSGGAGTTTLYAQLINSGEVRVESGSLRVTCGYSVPAGGTGTASGSIDAAVTNTGEITAAPSADPPLVVTGYTQSPLGNLTELIGGYSPGTQYGQIIVNGDVALNGTLQVQLINGFTPQLGDEFTVIVNNGIHPVDGTFIGLPEWTPGSPLVYSGFIGFSVSYESGDGNDVVLTVRQVAQPTTTFATASFASPLFGVDSITLTANVAAASGTPTGSVSFYDGATLLGSAALINGVAALPLADTDLAVGAHTIHAVYNGDGGFLGSEGTVEVNVISPSTIQGLVWLDFNNDGEVNFGEQAIAGVTITLTGFDDLGNAVYRTTQTDAQGIHSFTDLRPSNAAGYTLTESQPFGYLDGRDALGTIDNVVIGIDAVNDAFSGIVVPPGSLAENYNFGERPPNGGSVGAGQTATIGFWQNKHGQNLIKALNGGATSTQLGDWLAATFPNMYGMLDGMTNAQIAAHYKTLFGRNGQSSPGGPPKVDAQIMATALAVYVTNQSLAGTTAAAYGFQVTQYGVGTRTFNVGSSGAAFGVANNTTMSVMDLLFAVNARSHNGLLFDTNGDGQISAAEANLRTLANSVFSLINESGGI